MMCIYIHIYIYIYIYINKGSNGIHVPCQPALVDGCAVTYTARYMNMYMHMIYAYIHMQPTATQAMKKAQQYKIYVHARRSPPREP